jgi:type I restriction enzyme S subunit
MFGSAQPQLTIKILKSLLLPAPPIKEQRKIAEILSTWDKAINTTERLIDNSKQQKKYLMQQLLTGKKRLFDDSGKSLEGERVLKKLGNICKMNSGGTPKSSVAEYYGGDIPWVSIADMTKHGKWIESTARYLTKSGIENSSARVYPSGIVLYAMYASIGECSVSKVDLSSSQAILGIRPEPSLNNLYLYYFLSNIKSKIILLGQQGTQSNLNAAMVRDFQLSLPSLKEQKKIVSVLTNADKEIELLEQQLADFKQEKKALMQQLLTGKRRVKLN